MVKKPTKRSSKSPMLHPSLFLPFVPRQAIHFDDSKRLRRALLDAPRAARKGRLIEKEPDGNGLHPSSLLPSNGLQPKNKTSTKPCQHISSLLHRTKHFKFPLLDFMSLRWSALFGNWLSKLVANPFLRSSGL